MLNFKRRFLEDEEEDDERAEYEIDDAEGLDVEESVLALPDEEEARVPESLEQQLLAVLLRALSQLFVLVEVILRVAKADHQVDCERSAEGTLLPQPAMAGEKADDRVVAEEETEAFLVLHDLGQLRRLVHEEGELGFRGSAIHVIVKLQFSVLRQLLAEGQLGEVNCVDFVVAHHVDVPRVRLEKRDALLGQLLLLAFSRHLLLSSKLLLRFEGIPHLLRHALHRAKSRPEQ